MKVVMIHFVLVQIFISIASVLFRILFIRTKEKREEREKMKSRKYKIRDQLWKAYSESFLITSWVVYIKGRGG